MMEALEGLSHGLHLPIAIPLMGLGLLIGLYYWLKGRINDKWLFQGLLLDIPGKNGDCPTVKNHDLHHIISNLWARMMMTFFGWDKEGYMDVIGNKWAMRVERWFALLIWAGWMDTPEQHQKTLIAGVINILSSDKNGHHWLECADAGLQNCKKVPLIFILWDGQGHVMQNRVVIMTVKDMEWIKEHRAEFAGFNLGIWEFLRSPILKVIDAPHLTGRCTGYLPKKSHE